MMKKLFAITSLLVLGLGGALQADEQEKLDEIWLTALLDDSDKRIVGFNFSGTPGEKFIIHWGQVRDTVFVENTDNIEVSHVVKGTSRYLSIHISAMNPTGHILSLSIDSAYKYGSLNLRECPELAMVRVSNNNLENLSLDGCRDLKFLDCSYNRLSSIPYYMSNAKDLTHLDCSHNDIGNMLNLNDFKSLVILHCENNKINDLRARAIPTLREVYCQNNQIDVCELDSNPVLERVDCSNNDLPFSPSSYGCPNLAYLDISDNEHLETFGMYDNQKLEAVDFSRNPALKHVHIVNSNIKSLNFSANKMLNALDLNNLPLLQYLSCRNTQLKMLSLVETFALKTVKCSDNPLLESLTLHDCPSLDSLDFSDNIQLKDLTINHTKLSFLDLSIAPSLREVECNHNNLESLLIDNCTALETLRCNHNRLASLHLPAGVVLESLHCDSFPIIRFD